MQSPGTAQSPGHHGMLRRREKFCLSGGVEELIPRVTKAMEGLSMEDGVCALESVLWLLYGELDWKGTREGAGRQLSEKK